MAARGFSVSLPQELVDELDNLVEIIKEKTAARFTRNWLIRLCIKNCLDEHKEEIIRGEIAFPLKKENNLPRIVHDY
jgi:metal-responsive CopG/Arc/MetJ family transcriptional regulator